MSKIKCCLIFLLIVTFFNCCDYNEKSEKYALNPYLGQPPPGIVPEQFGVGFIDNDERIFAITFSPDGKECFYTKSFQTNTIMTTREIDGEWITPEIASFSGKYFDFEPYFTASGEKLIFGSMRPIETSNEQGGLHQWYIERSENDWTSPKLLGYPFIDEFCMYVTEAANGNIYFTGEEGIYKSEFIDGVYQPSVKLSQTINNLPWAAHPCIAPDESFLIFDAQIQEGNADLFISFKSTEEEWCEPIPFDSSINTSEGELCALLSHDGKYLFFSRILPGKGDIYWVDAKVIDDLR